MALWAPIPTKLCSTGAARCKESESAIQIKSGARHIVCRIRPPRARMWKDISATGTISCVRAGVDPKFRLRCVSSKSELWDSLGGRFRPKLGRPPLHTSGPLFDPIFDPTCQELAPKMHPTHALYDVASERPMRAWKIEPHCARA